MKLKWKEIVGAITPGGDPAYMCPVCFHGEHVYGVEHNEPIHKCPVCGAKLIYPWEESMTEQELQDKAKDLAKSVPLRKDISYPETIRNFLASMYLRGYDDGKNDITKWHYPSRGELPEKDVECLVITKSGSKFIAMIDSSDNCWCTGEFFSEYISDDCVDCWQYIIQPEGSV